MRSLEAPVERFALHLWSSTLGTTLLIAHIVGMALSGFTQGASVLTYFSSALGLAAVPICAWQLSRRLDLKVEKWAHRPLFSSVLRLFVGTALVALAPAAYRVLEGLPLPLIGRVLELSTVVLSIAVMTGLVLISLGFADSVFLITSPLKLFATRLMVLLFFTALGHFFWLSFVGYETHQFLQWAISEGHLEAYVQGIEYISDIASVYIGGLAGAVGFELPFLLLIAWRFGRNATRGLSNLHDGFDRVASGNFDERLEVQGNDEVAEMQRGFNSMLEAAREQRFLENAFGRYVSPVVLEQLRKKDDIELLKGESKVATVLFSDIRGFTALSSTLRPEQVIALLNAYLSVMIETIARFDGYINKFAGDSIMVVWNAPIDQRDHALRALACAQAMQDELERANENNMFGEVDGLTMGIGINTGPLVYGNLGNERQVEFTVIGDTVNVASRACGHAGGRETVMTRSVVEQARKIAGQGGRSDLPETDSLGLVEVKGKGEIEFFRLLSSAKELKEHLVASFAPPEVV